MGRLTARRPTPQRPSPAAPPRECLPTPGGVAARRGWPPLAAAAVSGRCQRLRAAGGGGDGVSRSRGRAQRQASPPPAPLLTPPSPRGAYAATFIPLYGLARFLLPTTP